MGKSTITPMDYYYYQLHIHKISKRDLEEAGIIIDYTDDELYRAAKKIQENRPNKKDDDEVKDTVRWVFLGLIMIYLSVIMWVGVVCAESEERGAPVLENSYEVRGLWRDVGDEFKSYF